MTQHDMDHFGAMERGQRRLFVDVSDKIADKLAEMARTSGVSRNLYVSQLSNAAYAARCAPTGDRELDAAMRGGSVAPAPAPVRMAAVATPDRSSEVADLARQLAAAKAREKALDKDLAAAREGLLAASAQISAASAASRANVDLETELEAARTKAAREAERLEGARGAAAALRDDLARQQQLTDELQAEMSRRASDAVKLAAKLDRAEAVIREMNAELEARPEEVAPPIAATAADPVVLAPVVVEVAPSRALTAGEIKIVRGWAAVGRSIPSIATETGFPRAQIAAVLKKRAA